MFLVIFFAALLVFMLPGAAHAWGPATHLELGFAVLKNSGQIAGAARALIEAFPYDFLYGNISADIVVGKNLVEEIKHCHNWKVGFRLLKRARSDSQRAFAYGYLCHLAADTVAHNHFIPEMMIRSFSTRTLRHIYWEMRFDALADKRVWLIPRKMIKQIHSDHEELLDSIIEDSPFSFRTNKTIFSGMINLQRFEQWHRMLGLLSATSRWALEREERQRFFDVSLAAVFVLLNNGQRASCVKKDPTGRHSLNSAKFIRKRLKTIRRNGRDWQDAMDNALEMVKL